jgi:ADP-heptose:LPS heptosyltransferase
MHTLLAIRGGALGDFLLTLPAMEARRQQLGPETQLQLLTRPSYGRLCQAMGWVTSWRSLENSSAASIWSPAGVEDPDFKNWLANFSQILAWVAPEDVLAQGNLEKLAPGRCIFFSSRPDPRLPLPAWRQWAPEPAMPFLWKTVESLPVSRSGLALHPGSGSASKNLPLSFWQALVEEKRHLEPSKAIHIILGEVELERPEIAVWRNSLQNAPNLFWHENEPLEQLVGLLHAVEAFIGHDSGIAHLAATCSTPSTVWFGPASDPVVWAPPGAQIQRWI